MATKGGSARAAALALLDGVLNHRQTLDELLDRNVDWLAALDARDRAFAHALAASVLRRKGEAEGILCRFLNKSLPRSSGSASLILLMGVAQLLFLDIPAHAAIHATVELARADTKARHFAGLINAVLRRVAAEPAAPLEPAAAARLNTPDWLWHRWEQNWGPKEAAAIAIAHQTEPPLDLTPKADPQLWADRLGGALLPTSSIRLDKLRCAVGDLPGYDEGAWWVQDAAAALPARLLGDVADKRVADLCAAPGGKTAQLAAAGAAVVAVDASVSRLSRVAENLARLHLQANLVAADVLDWTPDALFDAILLDAPCSATGTIRRHPDLPFVKSESSVSELADLQRRMLARASNWLKPGGILVYCTCSLEPEEGEQQVARLFSEHQEFRRKPITDLELAGQQHFINADGDLRTNPAMPIGAVRGLDGFFASRLERAGPG